MKLSCPLPSCFPQALSLGVPICKTKVVLVPTFCDCGGGLESVCVGQSVWSVACGWSSHVPGNTFVIGTQSWEV